MPGQDRTGPNGQGPMTGRGLGLCGNGGIRRGFGRGCGRGFRQRALTQEEEKGILEQELKSLEKDKEDIQNRLKEFN